MVRHEGKKGQLVLILSSFLASFPLLYFQSFISLFVYRIASFYFILHINYLPFSFQPRSSAHFIQQVRPFSGPQVPIQFTLLPQIRP
jgi:hypothetical protein